MLAGYINIIKGAAAGLIRIYTENRVARSAAALSYSLTLSVFPLLICVSAVFGRIDITTAEIISLGHGIVPASALEFLAEYFEHASVGNTRALFAAGIAMLLASSSSSFRSIENTMADIHGAVPSQKILHVLESFLFSILFLLSVYVSCGVILSGRWIFAKLTEYFAIELFAGIWHWLRFVVLFIIMYFMIFGLYRVTVPDEYRHVNRGTGAFFSAAALVAMSIVFSWFIEMSTRYTLIYGSLASIIIMMIWFYMCGIVLIMGNAVNVVIHERIAGKR